MERFRAELDGSFLGRLQWSHGILAMERSVIHATLQRMVFASMEPWHFSHGEPRVYRMIPNHAQRFNGAMAF